MIIDSLTHVTPDGRWFSTSFDASEGRLLREMDDAGVDKSVVVALAGYIENDFVARVCARHPERLIPGLSINPLAYPTAKEAVTAFRSLQGHNAFAVLKLHPRLNKYDPLSSECLTLLEGVAASPSPLPIWLDTIFQYPGASLSQSAVHIVHELVRQFPPLIFVLLHAGGAEALRLAEAVRDYPNVFLDISYTMHRYRGSSVETDLKYLLRFLDRQMIFGSDFPEVSLKESVDDFNSLGLDLDVGTRHRVLGDNLQSLLHL